jgi:sestrin 1/3
LLSAGDGPFCGSHGGSEYWGSWTDVAHSILSHILPDVTNLIDEEYIYIKLYTNNLLGKIKVQSTEPVREAMFIYVQRLYGLVHNDFDYQLINR